MVNAAEAFVTDVCTNSFFSLWSYPNPRGKKGKELCDFLVVCAPHVVVFSVKEIEFKDTGNTEVDWGRWRSRAIKASSKQLYGATRWIKSAESVIDSNGNIRLPFPEIDTRQVHLIAVALGSKGKAPLTFGDFGKGFIHVFDEFSFSVLMQELDTISDFTEYLSTKEEVFAKAEKTLLTGAEEDLLAWYLHNGRTFPTNHGMTVIGPELWEGFTKKTEFVARKKQDEVSYFWDKTIDIIARDIAEENLEYGGSLSDNESALRIMVQETRFSRRILGDALREFLELAEAKTVRSRMVVSLSNVVYVFLAVSKTVERKDRLAELGCRCFIARNHNPELRIVVGLATNREIREKGFSFDLFYFDQKEWCEEDQKKALAMQEDLGFFQNPDTTPKSFEEYPDTSNKS